MRPQPDRTHSRIQMDVPTDEMLANARDEGLIVSWECEDDLYTIILDVASLTLDRAAARKFALRMNDLVSGRLAFRR